MTGKSLIIGIQLKRARNLLNLTLEEVSYELDVSSEGIANWENEKTKPNLEQLEKLAKLYGREIDYFLKNTPEPPNNIEFRGMPDKSLKDLSKETRIILAEFDEFCRTIYEFEILLNKKRKIKLTKFKGKESPKSAAQALRKEINLIDKPIPKLRNILENEGARIFELPIPSDEFSGFSYWHHEYGPCILLNAKEPQGRRNFTLAHELSHLLFGHGSSVCYIPLKFHRNLGNIEYKANQFAIELLLPESIIIEDFEHRQLSTTPTMQELRTMAFKWGVSIQALGYRLENLDILRMGHTDTLLEPEKKPFYRRPSTPTYERRLGKYYVETSITAYKKNIITIGKLAHALQLPVTKTMEVVKHR